MGEEGMQSNRKEEQFCGDSGREVSNCSET